MISSEDFMGRVRRVGLVAIIRATEPGVATRIGERLIAEGVELLEVALTTPDACEAITSLRRTAAETSPGDIALVGAGTVLTAADVDAVQQAGADFIVTPAVSESISIAAGRGIPVAAGAYTATEALSAVGQGACAVKLFPASAGGPSYMKALRDPLPTIAFIAVGGVGIDEIPRYREVGAIGFGVGSPLIGDAARGGDLDELGKRARAFVTACRVPELDR